MNESTLISKNFEKVIDLVSLPIKNEKDKVSKHNKLLTILKEDGLEYTEDMYISIFKTTLYGLPDDIKEKILCKDSIERINSNFNSFLRYINESIMKDKKINDYGYTLIVCYYIYLTS